MEWAVPAPFSAGWKHNEKLALGCWGWTLDSTPSLFIFTDIRRDQITILTLTRLGWWTVEVSHLLTEVHKNLFLFETQQNKTCCKNNLPDVHDNRRKGLGVIEAEGWPPINSMQSILWDMPRCASYLDIREGFREERKNGKSLVFCQTPSDPNWTCF